MKRILLFMLAVGTLTYFSACEDDDGETVALGNVSISGIPASAQVAQGDSLVVPGVTLTADAGIQTFTLQIGGGAPEDLAGDLGIVSETSVTTTLALATDDLPIGVTTLTFVLTDANGNSDDFQHDLNVQEFGVVTVSSDIDSDVTWTANNVYVLAGRITVTPGNTLTIEPGTVIKGEAGSQANATALLVARGATINANGSADLPIIFTSVADELTPTQVAAGDVTSPNLDPTQNGLWGGVIILGSAPVSVAGNLGVANIEGIPDTDPNGEYGGDDAADNSGTFRYVSIRHGGTNIGAGNEINGLSLGGVGSGTTIEFVEIVANQDDGIEWFGGDVDINWPLVWNSGDDALDTDQDWAGTCSNYLIVTPQGSAFELDGPEGTDGRGTDHVFSNGSVFLGRIGGSILDFDDNTNAEVDGVYFYGFENNGPVASASGKTLASFEYTFPSTWDDDNDDETPEVPWPFTEADVFPGVDAAVLSEVNLNANTVGITSSNSNQFSWTWASQSNALSGIGL